MATEKDTGFKELKIDSMIEHDPSSSTELWLVQWPFYVNKKSSSLWPNLADFDGQEATLKLNCDDELGTIRSSSGISYELRSLQSHTPEEVVYLSSSTDNKIVGKISRHVSLIHYPEPSELQKPDRDLERKLGQGTSSLTGSARRSATPTQTIRSRAATGPTPTRSSRKSGGSSTVVTGSLESSKSKKRKHTSEASASVGHSDKGSERVHSTVSTSGGSVSLSEERKSKKKKKNED